MSDDYIWDSINIPEVEMLVRLRQNLHSPQEPTMKAFDWKMRYAPHGYHFIRQRLGFDQMDRLGRVFHLSTLIEDTIQMMHDKLRREGPYFITGETFTSITIYPKQIGESLNHFDPLVLRQGIEIEIRFPFPPPASKECAHNER